MITTILAAVAGVLLPLGLSEGPFVLSNFRPLDAQYVPDTSPLAAATTPNRGSYVYGRICGTFDLMTCPGGIDPNNTAIPPSIVGIFNSIPHGSFSMQYRQFFQGDPARVRNFSQSMERAAQTFILCKDSFAVDGLIVDMSSGHPGVGFWNQTLPNVTNGATWTQDILWLEPVTECVNTNLTFDYILDSYIPNASVEHYNLTDHGGFSNLTRVQPILNRDGQHIDLIQHAYKGAVWSNLYALLYLNGTRESSFVGATYPLNSSSSLFSDSLGKVSFLSLSYLNTSGSDIEVTCEGYGGQDTANVTNVHVNCGIFLRPPLRTDGGDPRLSDLGSKWSQNTYSCSSATHASIQRVTFSTNSSSDLQSLQITRTLSGPDVLWATEKTDMKIADVDLFWGWVDDQYENNTSLWTVRAPSFYLPAGGTSMWGTFPEGYPAGAHVGAWGTICKSLSLSQGDTAADYSGRTDFAIL
ncbi:hypothetical protein P691DRAFT_764685 [Macrolepiota fuliginosa MF-IS2]|uniref:Glycoside hydrolase family 13 protein n=1 Tax=Macrolepiota fuliginosa MF-IS2 TaxID=1400762 RepID=A0A9P6BYY9_9AGAR|nr:hypothetical protein P691DRAFT_764685 [Macrolepiota fuliginosa MF-IS2]